MSKQSKTVLGISENIEAAFCYLFIWVSGLVFLLLEQKNDFVRFHALQSIAVFIGFYLLAWILVLSIIGIILIPLLKILGVIAWIVLMIKAYQGQKYKVPYIGDWVEKNLQ